MPPPSPSSSPSASNQPATAASIAQDELDPALWQPRGRAPDAERLPAPSASLQELRGFVEAHPEHPEISELKRRHDLHLAPCAPTELIPPSQAHRAARGGFASCTPGQVLTAEGMLARAERYVKDCFLCEEKPQVQALITRMRSVALTKRREEALLQLEHALARRDLEGSQQVIADHRGLGDAFLNYAVRKLKGVFSEQRLSGDLGDMSCASSEGSEHGSMLFLSPEQPVAGEKFSVWVVSEAPRGEAPLRVELSSGEKRELFAKRRGGGPPYFGVYEAELPEGSYRLRFEPEPPAAALASPVAARAPRAEPFRLCRRVQVRPRAVVYHQADEQVWANRRSWDRGYENLYSVWISVLFDAPEATTWRGFHQVTRQAERNLLFNHLGLGEDQESGANALRMTPDCADAPHFFRAYFAWKLGLPFGYHRCRYGSLAGAPRCGDFTTNQGVMSEDEAKAALAHPQKKPGGPRRSPNQDLRSKPSAAAEESQAGSPEQREGASATKASARAELSDAGGGDPEPPVAAPKITSGKMDGGAALPAPAGEPAIAERKARSVPFIRFNEPREAPGVEVTRFLGLVKNEITARSLRTDFADNQTDLYPIPLSRESLRPGMVYSDPYGHTYTLVSWRAQSEDQAGVLLAVDAQPDETVNIKRFWRGNFLFSPITKTGGHGFKAFRPIVLEAEPGSGAAVQLKPRLMNNWEIAVANGYGNFSLEQASLETSDFYGAMERLINPRPLSPVLAYRELHRALHRQLRQRVREIELAEEYFRRNEGESIEMPEGQAIFRTTGPWEALSTPCRDLRLLVGIDSLRDFPKQAILEAPEPEAVLRHLAALHERWSQELTIEYVRSDGSAQKISLREILQRSRELELGWNPNDCPELRWGANPDSEEGRSCGRRASKDQQRRMEAFRHWFANRYSCGG